MDKRIVKSLFGLLVFSLVLTSCKSSFEKLRTSNEPEKIYTEANNYFEEGEYMKAQILYEMVLPYYKGKKEAEEMYFKFAYTYYNLEDYMLAAHYFKSYANSFTNSPNREEALFMAAYSEYQMSPNYQLDQTQTNKAIDDFQLFVNTFPSSEKVEKCNQLMDKLREKLERKSFEQGHLYYKLGRYISAIVSFENMLKDFPETKREEEVRFLILKSSFKYSKNSIFEKKLERFNDTIERYKEFSKRFSHSKYINEAKKIYKYSLTEVNKIKNGYKI